MRCAIGDGLLWLSWSSPSPPHSPSNPRRNPKAFSHGGTKIGESVTLKDHGTAYSISFMDDELPLTHTVVEVGEDYVVVRDLAGMTDTVVPVYSLKGIVKTKTKLTTP